MHSWRLELGTCAAGWRAPRRPQWAPHGMCVTWPRTTQLPLATVSAPGCHKAHLVKGEGARPTSWRSVSVTSWRRCSVACSRFGSLEIHGRQGGLHRGKGSLSYLRFAPLRRGQLRVKQQMGKESVLIFHSPINVISGATLDSNCVFQI